MNYLKLLNIKGRMGWGDGSFREAVEFNALIYQLKTVKEG